MSLFTRVKHSKMLSRVQAAGLEGDEIGVYMMAFFLMCERDGPIGDDMPFLGRKCGVSTRRMNQIKVKLIDAGLWHQRGAQIGDKFALDEVEYRAHRTEVASSNAMSRWQKDGQPQLDLDNGVSSGQEPQNSAVSPDATASPVDNPGGGDASGGLSAEKTAENGAKIEDKGALKEPLNSEESAEISHSDPLVAYPDSHARATRENLEERDSSVDAPPDADGPGRSVDRSVEPPGLDDAPISTVLAAVCTAAGFNPTDKRAIETARRQVERWRAEGISFDRTVLPTIRDIVAKTDDPTSSLYRFDRYVRLAHAKVQPDPAVRPGNGAARTTIAIFAFPDEPERFVALRRDLCDALGPTRYCALAHDIRFEAIDDRPIVRISPAPKSFGNADHRFKDNCLSAVIQVARKHGFNQVW